MKPSTMGLKTYQEEDLSRIKKWSDHNKLPLNVKKCTHLDFGNTTKAFLFSGNEIQKHIVQKDLGLLISRDLKWRSLEQHVIKR